MQQTEFIPQATADGSFTFFSPEFGECFHSIHGARQEAELKFVHPTQLRLKAEKPLVRLLDICYGLGYNTAAALAAIWEENPNCVVEWVGLERDVEVPQAALLQGLLNSWPVSVQELLTELAQRHKLDRPQIKAQLLIGDARKTISTLKSSGFQADAIFLDPFSPPHCPQLWTVEFLTLVGNCLQPDGILATYSCSAAVRSALIAAGLEIGSTPPVGRRSPGTIAFKPGSQNQLPAFLELVQLSPQEQEHLQTRAAIPYRDPNLCEDASSIVHRRQIEQQQSSLEPASRWKKRWDLTTQIPLS